MRHHNGRVCGRGCDDLEAEHLITVAESAQWLWGIDTFRQAADQHGYPASTLTDNGMVYTVRLAGMVADGGRTP